MQPGKLLRLAAVVASLGAASCSGLSTSNTTTGYTNVTGIIIRADALVRDFGCGQGNGQVVAYGARVYDADRVQVVPFGLFDCFADATFTNLQASASQSRKFDLEVFAYDATSLKTIVDATNAGTLDEGTLLRNTGWGTSCEATQQLDVTVLAVCKPLRRTSRLTIDTRSFQAAAVPGADPPPPYTCGTDYTSVAFTATHPTLGDKYTNAKSNPNGTACPATILAPGVLPDETYQVTVTLVKEGRAVRTGKCSVYARAGADSPVVCPAL